MANEENEFSLAALAGLDTSDIAAMTSRLPERGVFHIQGISAELVAPKEVKEGKDPLYSVKLKAKILVARPLSKEVDPEKLVGKELTDTITLWPDTFKDEIALLKGRFKKAGLPYDGPMGGVEGHAGWLDGFAEAEMEWRIRHYTDKNDVERSSIDWAGLKTEESETA